MIKFWGAALILFSCGYLGFVLSLIHLKDMKFLRMLAGALEYMECDLECHMTALPELCRKGAQNCGKTVADVLMGFADELDMQVAPNAAQCMHITLSKISNISGPTKKILLMMGELLGNFDLKGQIKGLRSVRAECIRLLEECENKKDARVRGCRTLGLCAGAALAIVLL